MNLKVNQLLDVGFTKVEIAKVCKVSHTCVASWGKRGAKIPCEHQAKLVDRLRKRHEKINSIVVRAAKHEAKHGPLYLR